MPFSLLAFSEHGAREGAVVTVHVVATLVQQAHPHVVPAAQVDDGHVASASVSVVRTRVHPGHLLVIDDDGCLDFGVVARQHGAEEGVSAWQWGREFSCKECEARQE